MKHVDDVKEALKCCILRNISPEDYTCVKCPYKYVSNCREALINDALELLSKSSIKPYESRAMLPCVCGCKSREHWYGCDGSEQLICKRCGKKVSGISGMDVIRKWNKTIQEELASKTPL